MERAAPGDALSLSLSLITSRVYAARSFTTEATAATQTRQQQRAVLVQKKENKKTAKMTRLNRRTQFVASVYFL